MSSSVNYPGKSLRNLILKKGRCHGGAWNGNPPIVKGRDPLPGIAMSFMACLFFAFLFVILGCRDQESAFPYKILDSGIWAEEAGIESTGWIDNEHVLFITNKTLKPSGSIPMAKFLTVWNPDSGKVDFYHQAFGFQCVRKGNVFFWENSGSNSKATKWESTIYRGNVKNPKEHPAPRPSMEIDSSFDCDWVPGESFGRAPVRAPHTYKLKDKNYIEFTELPSNSSQGKMIYHEKPGTKGIPLPFYLSLAYHISYSEFLDAYVIVGDKHSVYPKPDTRSFWILERSGQLKSIPYPQSLLKGAVENIYPLKRGYLARYSQDQKKGAGSDDRGLWLIDGEKSVRLIVGDMGSVAVSPGGCRAAFIHAKNIKEYFSQKNPYRTVKVIDFCEGENKP